MPAIQKAAENGSVDAQPRNESASPQPRDPQMNAQKHGSMVSGNDTTGTTKIFERDKTNGTKSQFLKPLSADVARIIPCLRSNIVINHLQQIQNFDHTLQIAQLEIDISELYTIINQINARFWGDVSTFSPCPDRVPGNELTCALLYSFWTRAKRKSRIHIVWIRVGWQSRLVSSMSRRNHGMRLQGQSSW